MMMKKPQMGFNYPMTSVNNCETQHNILLKNFTFKTLTKHQTQILQLFLKDATLICGKRKVTIAIKLPQNFAMLHMIVF
jgi:hypothetical protein